MPTVAPHSTPSPRLSACRLRSVRRPMRRLSRIGERQRRKDWPRHPGSHTRHQEGHADQDTEGRIRYTWGLAGTWGKGCGRKLCIYANNTSVLFPSHCIEFFIYSFSSRATLRHFRGEHVHCERHDGLNDWRIPGQGGQEWARPARLRLYEAAERTYNNKICFTWPLGSFPP